MADTKQKDDVTTADLGSSAENPLDTHNPSAPFFVFLSPELSGVIAGLKAISNIEKSALSALAAARGSNNFLDLPLQRWLSDNEGRVLFRENSPYGVKTLADEGVLDAEYVDKPQTETEPAMPAADQPKSYTHTFNLAGAYTPKSKDDNGKGYKVFASAAKGRELRAEFNLDALDSTDATVRFEFPEDTSSITVDFFAGLMRPSVRKLGFRFERKYQFACRDGLKPQIKQAIDYCSTLDIYSIP